ncbi:carboxypeptidase-like regulatory domain-containing protein [Flavobacterium macacae]|uniref:Carboxypeptidase-like regulatory domain-containing protein n=1 Tax=Flavobacterium macacae TaxID=2488993 RepID=A0A3P3WGM6_9FLAO|nr:carboxypeptidase-like regulatory domain-containing protein [Flavobacterium macacae]RRJ93587.1 carboxypeptidase-like regulatory domain-containing protein [Flavobacterium macacae]
MKNILLVLFLGCFINVFSQTLEGTIYIKGTEIPLQSANVYLDGTTIATTTNDQGYFKIDSRGNTKSDLVISYIGFLTTRIPYPSQQKKRIIFLEEDAIAIEEVVIGRGPFSRKSMLKAFREQFLGTSKAALSCKILNEDDINLYFDIDTNILSATARNPLKIKNSYLGYEINFDLVDFQVKYKVQSLSSFYIQNSMFAGTTFYKDLSKKNKAAKKRKDTYLGSSPHLMYAIAQENWQKEKFKLFVDRFQVDPKEYFQVKDTLDMKQISIIKEPMMKVEKVKKNAVNFIDTSKPQVVEYEDKKAYFQILYDGNLQSIADFGTKLFYVDENGNYDAFYNILFGGYMGSLKAGDMLPSDYFQTIKENH